jgi:hypothetical protein
MLQPWTRRQWLGGLTAASVLVWSGPSLAHRGHSALCVVEIDDRTGAVTVVFRLLAHDVEPALIQIAPLAQPSLDDPEAVRVLIAYVQSAFTLLQGAEPRPVALSLAAQDIGAEDIRLTYRGAAAAGETRFEIRCALFADIYAQQETQVNVRRLGGPTRSLLFRPGDGPQTVALGPKV